MSICALPATIPGPPRTITPLRFLRGLRFFGDTMRTGGQLFDQYGSFVALSHRGGTNIYSPLAHCPGTVLTCDPQAVKQILASNDVFYRFPFLGTLYRSRDRSPRHRVLERYMTGLFDLNGPPHRQARQYLSPAFSQRAIAMYRDDAVAVTEKELESWSGGSPQDLTALTNHWSAKVMIQALLGVEMYDHEIQFFHDVVYQCGSPIAIFFILFPYAFPGSPFRGLLKDLETGEEIALGITERARSRLATGEPEQVQRLTVFSLLWDAQCGQADIALDQGQVLGHLNAMWTAGAEATGSALGWLLLLLSQHPAIAADLLDELSATLHGDAPTVEQLKHLPLLDHIVKEGLRLLPSAPWNPKVAVQETELVGYGLPPGTEVFLSLHHLHLNPDVYNCPKVFKPDRWETLQPKPWEYSPFSGGTRACIGKGLAILSLKVAIAMIVQRLRLEFVPTADINPGGVFTLTSPTPLLVKCHPQDRNFNQGVGNIQGFIREMVQLPH